MHVLISKYNSDLKHLNKLTLIFTQQVQFGNRNLLKLIFVKSCEIAQE